MTDRAATVVMGDELTIDVSVDLPDPRPGDLRSRDTYIRMIEEEFGASFPRDLTFEQAITLHNYYMFAKAMIDCLYRRTPYTVRPTVIRCLAAQLSKMPDVAKGVDAFMQRRFDRHADGDLSRSIRRYPEFSTIELALTRLLDDLWSQGARLDVRAS